MTPQDVRLFQLLVLLAAAGVAAVLFTAATVVPVYWLSLALGTLAGLAFVGSTSCGMALWIGGSR